MLPRRIPKPEKRATRWKSQAHRDFVRGHACCNCDSMAGIQVAHVRMGSGAGMGQKPDDFLTVSLCGDCHNGDQHTKLGEPVFWQQYQARTGQSVNQLIEEYIAASPKRREIEAIRFTRAAGQANNLPAEGEA